MPHCCPFQPEPFWDSVTPPLAKRGAFPAPSESSLEALLLSAGRWSLSLPCCHQPHGWTSLPCCPSPHSGVILGFWFPRRADIPISAGPGADPKVSLADRTPQLLRSSCSPCCSPSQAAPLHLPLVFICCLFYCAFPIPSSRTELRMCEQ